MPSDTAPEEVRSDEVQEIIGYVPNWIIRWGITAVFSVFAVILWISWFVKYPDVVKGRAVITTKTAPVTLVSKEAGNLQILIGDKQLVDSGDIIGYIQNTASLEDVLQLERKLREQDVNEDLMNFQLRLGDLQPGFSRLKLAWQKIQDYEQSQPQQNEIHHLKQQIASLQRLNQNLGDQVDIFRNEVTLAKEKFNTDSLFFANQIIAAIDFKERKAAFLQQRRALKNQEASILNNEYQIMELQKQVDRLTAGSVSEISSLNQELESSAMELSSAIQSWKRRYVFTTPFDGELAFLDFLQDDQFVQSGQQLFAILPKGADMHVRVTLPVYASGKVEPGQEVNIRLDHYPSDEYGLLLGKVTEVSALPGATVAEEAAYTLLVILSDGLRTSYNVQLPLRQQLAGEVEVITKDLRLVERVFNWINDLGN